MYIVSSSYFCNNSVFFKQKFLFGFSQKYFYGQQAWIKSTYHIQHPQLLKGRRFRRAQIFSMNSLRFRFAKDAWNGPLLLTYRQIANEGQAINISFNLLHYLVRVDLPTFTSSNILQYRESIVIVWVHRAQKMVLQNICPCVYRRHYSIFIDKVVQWSKETILRFSQEYSFQGPLISKMFVTKCLSISLNAVLSE